MIVLVGLVVMMLVVLTMLLPLKTYPVLGLLGLLLLKERWLMLSVSLMGLLGREVFAWVGVLRALVRFVWVGPKCVGLEPGALILVMGLWLNFIGIAVLLRFFEEMAEGCFGCYCGHWSFWLHCV